MKISIQSLIETSGSSIKVHRELPLETLAVVFGNEQLLSPVIVDATVTSTTKGVFVKGILQTTLSLLCTRCLTSFVYDLVAEFEDEYRPKSSVSTDLDEELLSGEEVPTFEGDHVDISELLHDSIVLAIPMKVICATACEGICLVCGQNLNEKTCQCVKDKPDPRLAPLADLLKKEEER